MSCSHTGKSIGLLNLFSKKNSRLLTFFSHAQIEMRPQVYQTEVPLACLVNAKALGVSRVSFSGLTPRNQVPNSFMPKVDKNFHNYFNANDCGCNF